jgi:hypothetical protein
MARTVWRAGGWVVRLSARLTLEDPCRRGVDEDADVHHAGHAVPPPMDAAFQADTRPAIDGTGADAGG